MMARNDLADGQAKNMIFSKSSKSTLPSYYNLYQNQRKDDMDILFDQMVIENNKKQQFNNSNQNDNKKFLNNNKESSGAVVPFYNAEEVIGR
jgi:hypothetical protein